ncbi:MAG: tyrosine-type recombinase/integrase, partial [Firmicutes bacterium]|nr:tyrosine-type recombinase/integrase [Bacillota bacterium]
NKKTGRCDLALLLLLYDTGARVQEIADLTVSSVRLEPPAQVTLLGKGRKMRAVPLMSNTVAVIEQYLKENRLNEPQKMQYPLFSNHRNEKLTRAGISYILKKYVDLARKIDNNFPENVTPHVLRHSKAMHLLEAGVNVVYIRDILGHSDVSTTEIYAKANLNMKRAALEKVAHIASTEVPSWTTDAPLMEWLSSFGKSLT